MPNIIVTTVANAEEVLAMETGKILTLPDNRQIKVKPGQISFNGTIDDAYALCLHSRIANRVLLVLTEGQAADAEGLYTLVQKIDWPAIFASSTTFSVQAKGTNRALNNTQFIAQKVKDAIVDSFIENDDKRPVVDRQKPQIQFQVRINRDYAQICLDMSLTSLHIRGYRDSQGEAPLKENVAALLLYRSGWAEQSNQSLFDPMCGSGTLLIEAATMLKKIPPNLARTRWGFEHYLGHKKRAWQAIVGRAEEEILTSVEGQIVGTDIDHKMIDIAKANIKAANLEELISVKQGNALQQPAVSEQGFIISNPPYGERLNSHLELLPLYHQWGKYLKQHYANWKLALICSEQTLLDALRLRSYRTYKIKNGPLDCHFNLYHLTQDNLVEFSQLGDDNEFANRIIKNKKRLQKWLKSANTNAYRLYDADLPNYNFAIDIYADWVIVQEYKAPKSIPEKTVKQRLQHAIMAIPSLLDVKYTNIVLKVREKKKGSAQYNKIDKQNQQVMVYEGKAKFAINPHDYLDVGLFLDHRITRQRFASACHGKDVLNLFCYTGSVSVQAALAGARSIVSVDMSRTYIDWAKKNFTLNQLKGRYHFEQADCLDWVAQAVADERRRFDAIFADPPAFSNSKRMQTTWDVQRDHAKLLGDLKKLLNPNGFIYFSNNLRTFSLDQTALENHSMSIKNISQETLPQDFSRNPKIHNCWVIQ